MLTTIVRLTRARDKCALTENCIDGHLSVSGNSNTVTVDGHCASVTVSGNANAVVVDSADSITLAGIDGTVTSHSGSPKISNRGISNTATQG
jgi:hypothetical protein